jgi:hypothetical protein
MKWLGALLAFISLSGCAVISPALTGERIDETTVIIETSLSPTLIIASSGVIESWEPVDACVRSGNYEDEVSGLKCTAPNIVKVYGVGSYSIQVIDGIIPVTRFIQVK